MNNRPNIILIYTDQQRYDTLGVNGNALIQTPHLDKLALEGIRFTRNYATTPLCTPSRVAMFTGRYNHSNGSLGNSTKIKPTEEDFASILRGQGYTTALAGKDHCFGDRLKTSFDWVQQATHAGFHKPADELERAINTYRKDKMFVPYTEDPFPAEHNVTAKVFRWGKEFIERSKDGPFFLWLSIPDPHPPYMVPEPYASMYDHVEVPLPASSEQEMAHKPYRQQLMVKWNQLGQDYPTRERQAKLVRTYWGMVSYVDQEVGKLMAYLNEQQLEEDTLVIFTSDHGDYLGEHGMIRKGVQLYESLTHVPLLIRWKGRFASAVTDAMTCNIDLFPTLLELLELEIPKQVQGRSVLAVLEGKAVAHRDMVFMEHGLPGLPLMPGRLTTEQEEVLRHNKHHHLSTEVLTGKTKAVRTERWKYCVNHGDIDELYDLIHDPHEQFNLAQEPEYQDIVMQHKDYLLEWLIETE